MVVGIVWGSIGVMWVLYKDFFRVDRVTIIGLQQVGYTGLITSYYHLPTP